MLFRSWHDEKQGSQKGEPLGENTIYTIETEDLKLCHLGDLGQKELTADQLEKIGEVDILMIPVGGIYTISSKEAPKIMAQIEPKIIIPMHYQVPKLKIHPVKSREAGAKQFNGVKGAKGVLFNVSGGDDLSLTEIGQAAKIITKNVDSQAKIIFGAVKDSKLKKGEVKIMVIATGF